jgi:glycerol-3-phosphate dehydrogenase
VGRLRWKLGLSLYDLLAGAGQPVAPHQALSGDEVANRFPFLRRDALVGGFGYGDCITDDARCTLEIVDGALEAGATAVNGAEATRLLRDGSRITGAEIKDIETGNTLEVRATVTVSCSGPWGTGEPFHGVGPPTRMTKGVHLVLPPLPTDQALLLLAPSDGRVVFLLPWYGRTLLGTTDTPYAGHPDAVRVKSEDVDYLLHAANQWVTPSWQASDVLGGFAGIRVLQNQPGLDPSQVTREWSLEQSAPGLLTLIGGKFSTARADSTETVDRAMKLVGRQPGARPTEERPFPWAPAGDFEAWLETAVERGVALGLDTDTAMTAALRFGSRLDDVHARIKERPDLAARLHPELPFCRAEVEHAVEHEMARSLDDVLRRRIPLAILARRDARVATDAADLAASMLGWSPEHTQRQLTHLATTTFGPAEPAP